VSALAQLSDQLQRAGYSRSFDGTFIPSDRRRVVVLLEADPDPARWPEQVSTALAAPAVQQAAAWARYVVLLRGAPPDDRLRFIAAAFARDVTKCRRLVVFADGTTLPTLPFLPLDTRPIVGKIAPEADTSAIIARHLGPELSTVFEDPNNSHAAVQREIERRVDE
jgi:hypothetical protein